MAGSRLAHPGLPVGRGNRSQEEYLVQRWVATQAKLISGWSNEIFESVTPRTRGVLLEGLFVLVL